MVTAYDAEGHDTVDRLTHLIEKDLDFYYKDHLDEKGVMMMKKTVQLIAVWHLKKHLMESFASDPDVFKGLIVELTTFFGLNKYKRHEAALRATRVDELKRVKNKVKLVEILKTAQGKLPEEKSDVTQKDKVPDIIDEIVRLDDAYEARLNDELHVITENVTETLNTLQKEKQVSEEQREGEELSGEGGGDGDGGGDGNDASNDGTAVILNEICVIEEIQALVRVLKQFESNNSSIQEETTELLKETYINFQKNKTDGKVPDKLMATYDEVDQNYTDLQDILARRNAGENELEFRLTDKAKKDHKMSFDRLCTILTGAYNGAILGKEEIRTMCVRTYQFLIKDDMDIDTTSDATNDATEDEIEDDFMSWVNDDTKFQTVLERLARERPAASFFYNCAYGDLRLAIEPFRDLCEGNMQTLVDNLPRMAAALAYSKKTRILRNVLTTIGRFKHMEEKQTKLLLFIAENCKSLFNDWHGECVNSRYRQMLPKDLINITKEQAEEASLFIDLSAAAPRDIQGVRRGVSWRRVK